MEMHQVRDQTQQPGSSERVVSNDEWANLFSNFRNYLFRLEALPAYDSPAETELIERFSRGEDYPPQGPLKEYFESLEQLVKSGRQIERVHVVPDVLTPYLRWEIEWCYRHMAERGVKVFLLPESKAPSLAAKAYEFYLIDDSHLIRVEYDHKGGFLRLLQSEDPIKIDFANKLRRELLEQSIPFDEFMRRAV